MQMDNVDQLSQPYHLQDVHQTENVLQMKPVSMGCVGHHVSVALEPLVKLQIIVPFAIANLVIKEIRTLLVIQSDVDLTMNVILTRLVFKENVYLLVCWIILVARMLNASSYAIVQNVDADLALLETH
jgi:predicted ABC-type sugar transport system permease subunit